MKSTFFYNGRYRRVAEEIKEYLNREKEFLSQQTVNSTRAAGDAIEELLADKFESFLGDWCAEYSSSFARRAMADLAFLDREDFYCVIDVKTHREDTKFNMPNLTSVERLSRFYEDDKNVFALVMVKYKIEGFLVRATEVVFSPIEFLDWECLTIGALGWGQIQIQNSNRILVRHGYSRREWMLKLCEIMFDFYPREILKINSRLERFRELKSYWEHKRDVWT